MFVNECSMVVSQRFSQAGVGSGVPTTYFVGIVLHHFIAYFLTFESTNIPSPSAKCIGCKYVDPVRVIRMEDSLFHPFFRSALILPATCGSSFFGGGLAMANRFSEGLLTTTIVEFR